MSYQYEIILEYKEQKGPVKLIQGVKITTSPTCCVKTFILSFQACVGSSRHMTAKEFFETCLKIEK